VIVNQPDDEKWIQLVGVDDFVSSRS